MNYPLSMKEAGKGLMEEITQIISKVPSTFFELRCHVIHLVRLF